MKIRRIGALILAASIGCLALPAASPSRADPPAPAADPAQFVLSEGFENGRLSPDSGLFYKDGIEQRAGSIAFRSGDALRGRGSVVLSVTSSCAHRSDACAERAEIWERPEMLARFDQSVWYGLAIRLDDPVPQDDARYVLAQWKREATAGAMADYSPFMAVRLYGGRLGITIETDLAEAYPIGGADRPKGCLPGEARVLGRPDAGQTRALVAIESGSTLDSYPDYFDSCSPQIQVTGHDDLPSAQKGWIDFVFRSKPGPAGDGHVEILADGVHIATVKGKIGHAGPGLDQNQYFKFGPYRAPSAIPWSVSYDDFRRGPRCTDVIRAGQCPPE